MYVFSGPSYWRRHPGEERMMRSLRKIIDKARRVTSSVNRSGGLLHSSPISCLSSKDMEEPLTLSHLLLGCHLLCTLPDPVTHSKDPEFEGTNAVVDPSHRVQHLNQILEHFWRRWRSEYLVGLRESHTYSWR